MSKYTKTDYMFSRLFTCCFSGYRPEKLPWREDEGDTCCLDLKFRIYEQITDIYESGITNFICGMARGSDTYFAEAVLSFKETHDDVTLEAAIPFREQAVRWAAEDISRYNEILDKCDIITYVSEEYSPDCMYKRNRYMVDRSSVVLCVYDGIAGGTSQTLKYAQKRGLEVRVLEPSTSDS